MLAQREPAKINKQESPRMTRMFRSALMGLMILAITTISFQPVPAFAGMARFALELHDLSSLKINYVVTRKPRPYAMVYDTKETRGGGLLSDVYVYRVEVGDYIGKDYGFVHRIDRCGIWITEMTLDSAGDWLERRTVLKADNFETNVSCTRAEKTWLAPRTNSKK